MARMARIVVPGCPHHVAQRENRRQKTFFCDDDYRYYIAPPCRSMLNRQIPKSGIARCPITCTRNRAQTSRVEIGILSPEYVQYSPSLVTLWIFLDS